MSKADGRALPALDTFPGLVLTLTALSGELPAALVSRLPAADTYKEYAVKQLKRDNLLRTFYRYALLSIQWQAHLEGFQITKKAIVKLLLILPAALGALFYGGGYILQFLYNYVFFLLFAPLKRVKKSVNQFGR